jgi:glutaconate CoA-transferase subunit B
MVLPTQLDRFGQSNLSAIGDYAKPQVALLGVRGLPGNSIHHANSFFIPNHSPRTLVAREVDMVGGIGYNPARWPGGRQPPWLDLRLVVTSLAVLDFAGPQNQIRVRSLHPGVSFEQVQDNTGFPLYRPQRIDTTVAPTDGQVRIIRDVLDPHGQRESVFKGNPPGDRRA